MSSRFNGLSGKIRFKDGELSSSPIYQIINIVQKSYIELGFWSPDFGFSQSVNESSEHMTRNGDQGITKVFDHRVYWPGGLIERHPQGWAMPTIENPLKIGVPGRTTFEMFVKVEEGKAPTGFCIDVFDKAVKLLGYDLPHVFKSFNGTYDDLVDQVYLKVRTSNFETLLFKSWYIYCISNLHLSYSRTSLISSIINSIFMNHNSSTVL